VLIERNFSVASEVLMIWCGYSGPAGMSMMSPARIGMRSSATRKVPSPSRMMNISSSA